jgi:flagellar hook-length control protein FliK
VQAGLPAAQVPKAAAAKPAQAPALPGAAQVTGQPAAARAAAGQDAAGADSGDGKGDKPAEPPAQVAQQVTAPPIAAPQHLHAAPAVAATPVTPAANQTPQANPGTPANQIAAVVAPLKLDADGIHRLSINLHPADLGPVNIIAELRNGDIHIQLSGATAAGREALQAALPDLRRELQDAGFDASSFDMTQHSPRDGQAQQQFAQQAPRSATRTPGQPAKGSAPEPQATPAVRPTPGNRQLDLHV